MRTSTRCYVTLAGAAAIVGIWFPAPAANADVSLHGLFTDNMVLQRHAPVPVYGSAPDGTEITVELAGNQAHTVAANGHWSVQLPPMEAGGPHELIVRGHARVTLANVLVGDVWLCTGQSNMAGLLQNYRSAQYADYQHLFADAQGDRTFDRIRLFKVGRGADDKPRTDVPVDTQFGPGWRVCDPDAALLFSCTGYFFGRLLHEHIDVPIGLIYSTVGGTAAESWVAPQVLTSHPEFASILESYRHAVDTYPEAFAAYEQRLRKWQDGRKAGEPVGRRPQPPMGPEHLKRPSGLYHHMIAPLQDFRIRGVIWYQGESNAGRPEQYRTLFPALISSWRDQWNQGDFPFLFVQLASFHTPHPDPRDAQWPWLREAQAAALQLPNTGMAVAIDAGHQTNIHPPFKRRVADRLVRTALKVAYGQDVVAHGPTFERMELTNGKAIIHFTHVHGGLVAKELDLDGHHLPAGTLRGFAIRDRNGTFKWADAVIHGNTVVVSHPHVPTPAAVRYAWDDFPLCNLYNAAGLPAPPFRTDTLPRGATSRVTGIAVGKPVSCDQPINHPKGFWNGLTDGSTVDARETSWATNAAPAFPKHATVDLQGAFTVTAITVFNSAYGGTRNVTVQLSRDGEEFTTVGTTEFENYTASQYQLQDLNERGVTHVRLVLEDVHPISFQRQPNGFVFLRELHVEGTPE